MNIKKYFNLKIVVGIVVILFSILITNLQEFTLNGFFNIFPEAGCRAPENLLVLLLEISLFQLAVSYMPLFITGFIISIWGIIEKTIPQFKNNRIAVIIIRIIFISIIVLAFTANLFTIGPMCEMHGNDSLSFNTSGNRKLINNSEIYRNEEYGFEFQIPLNIPIDDNAKCNVKQEENKFIICGENGQSVEIFRKDLNKSLKEVIEEQFLKNSPSEMCWVEEENDENGWTYASIDYPTETNPEKSPWENRKFCTDYSKINGIVYFIMDPKYPDRFAFFEIGQDALLTIDEETWQSTFHFF